VSTKKFVLGQRVRVKTSRVKGRTGTIIGRGRRVAMKVWFVELDVADAFGNRMFRGPDRRLQPLSPELDPPGRPKHALGRPALGAPHLDAH
jgi:hypothetical protein